MFADEATTAGFGQIITPMFEDVGVFVRLGEATDVVSKELYSFTDKGGREIALRPEFTASVCRSFVQHRPLTPWKTWYVGSGFRYDKPQKGRYRQFDQVGVEVIGSDDPDIDTELIALAWRFFRRIGLTDFTLVVNSLGDAGDRPRYQASLVEYLKANRSRLSEQAQKTMVVNPLRVLDSKRPGDAAVASEAPVLADYLSHEASSAFNRVLTGLDALGIDYRVEPRLVRGLDYYTRTTFEFVSHSLDAAQNALGGGGRYDGLVEALGGPPEPGVGFALGLDRTLLACDEEGAFLPPLTNVAVWVVCTTDDLAGLEAVEELRSAGISADRSYDARSMKAQMKAANRSGAEIAAIIGSREVEAGTVAVRALRDSRSGDQQQEIDRRDLVKKVRSLLS